MMGLGLDSAHDSDSLYAYVLPNPANTAQERAAGPPLGGLPLRHHFVPTLRHAPLAVVEDLLAEP
jgi:hypothetical protein